MNTSVKTLLFFFSSLIFFSCNSSKKFPGDPSPEIYTARYITLDSIKEVLEELNERDQKIRKKLTVAMNDGSNNINTVSYTHLTLPTIYSV